MKTIIGFLSTSAVLCFVTIALFVLWDIAPIDWSLIGRIVVSVFLVTGSLLIVWLCWNYFFVNEPYNKEIGNKAHPKK